jgi:hypothetical protein
LLWLVEILITGNRHNYYDIFIREYHFQSQDMAASKIPFRWMKERTLEKWNHAGSMFHNSKRYLKKRAISCNIRAQNIQEWDKWKMTTMIM